MKTAFEVVADPTSGWEIDEEYGLITMDLGEHFVQIEPLLYGASSLAVYRKPDPDAWLPDIGGELVGEKMPITLGTPAQRGALKR